MKVMMRIPKRSHYYICSLLVGALVSPAMAQTFKPESKPEIPSPSRESTAPQSTPSNLQQVANLFPTIAPGLATGTPSTSPASVTSTSKTTPQLSADQSLGGVANLFPSIAPTLVPTSSPAQLLGQVEQAPSAPLPANPDAPAPAPTPESTPFTYSPRVGVRYTTQGAGYQQGFTSFEGFLPIAQSSGNSLTFVEGRFLLQNNASVGGNAIVGQRFFDAASSQIYGGYIAYDFRNTGNSSFNQIGAGLEAIGDSFEARINGYFPVGTNRNQIGTSAVNTPAFSGNSLVFNTIRQFEAAATVVDAEVGSTLFALGDRGSLRGFVGGYYINAPSSPDAFGIRGRLQARPTDYIDLNLSIQNDRLFDTRVVVSIGVNFPGTDPTPTSPENPVLNRMAESVSRQSAILVADSSVSGQTETTSVVAINNRTGQAYRFLHVVSGSGGSGTIESPFGTVQAALNAAASSGTDVIYVQGSGSETLTNPQIASGTSLLFNRTPQFTPDPVRGVGFVLLPSGTNPGGVYTLGSTQSLRVLGNNTVISGLTITNPNGPGISASNVSNLTLQNNTINNPNGPGIALTNVTGTLNVTNNTVNGTTGPLNSGLALINNSGTVNLTIANNTFRNTTNNGIGITLQGTAQGTGTISGNTLSGNAVSGILLQTTDTAQGTFTVSNNNILSNTGSGIALITSGSSLIRATIDSNPQITSNAAGGVVLTQLSGTSQILARVRLNPVVTGNSGIFSDVNLQTLGTGRVCLQSSGNTIGTLNLNNTPGATIQVEGGLPASNTAPTTTGTITTVAAGTCGF